VLGCCEGEIMTFDYCLPVEPFTVKRNGGPRHWLGHLYERDSPRFRYTSGRARGAPQIC
jgi:hypothetical protein